MKDTFISSEGRIGKVAYIFRVVAILAVLFGVSYAAIGYFNEWHEGHYSALGPFVAIVAGIIALFFILMQLLKRLHDAEKPVYLSLFLLVPGLNLLLLAYAAILPSKGRQ